MARKSKPIDPGKIVKGIGKDIVEGTKEAIRQGTVAGARIKEGARKVRKHLGGK